MSRFTALAAASATAALFAAVHTTLLAQPEPSLAEVPLSRLQSMVDWLPNNPLLSRAERRRSEVEGSRPGVLYARSLHSAGSSL